MWAVEGHQMIYTLPSQKLQKLFQKDELKAQLIGGAGIWSYVRQLELQYDKRLIWFSLCSKAKNMFPTCRLRS